MGTQTRTELKQRMDLKTIAILSRALSVPLNSRGKSLLMTRRSWKMRLKIPSNGSMRISVQRKKNLRKSRNLSKVLQCQFFRLWEEVLAECPEVCLEACPEACPEACQEACPVECQAHLEVVLHLQL